MDYNKDLTMESDFIGMFNYPAGRRNNYNNPVDPAVIQNAVNSYLKNNPGTGRDGKSAYEQAVDGGYTGTEAEFKQALAGLESMSKADMLNILRGGDNAWLD